MTECFGCGRTTGHKASGSMICEYASEQSILFDSETGEQVPWPSTEDE